MGKKKFIDKKKSATFQLLARDSSDPLYNQTPGSDRLFVRVDNNQYSTDAFFDDDVSAAVANDPNSIFADADEDNDNDNDNFNGHVGASVKFGEGFEGGPSGVAAQLPENVRREILELGFPDDGYNYLIHLREIRNTGGGSNYYENPSAQLNQLPSDVKAYDASRVQISRAEYVDRNYDKSMYSLASKAVGVKVQKAFDPEVAAFLDDSDLSQFGSDVEDLEEDFVVRANLPEKGQDVDTEKNTDSVDGLEVIDVKDNGNFVSGGPEKAVDYVHGDEEQAANTKKDVEKDFINQEPRRPRALDEQFDILVREEYGSDDEDDEYGVYNSEEDESLAAKLTHTFADHGINDLGLDEEYKVPADLLHGKEKPKNKEVLEEAADIVRLCVEYAKKYENENENEDDVVLQESSDESEEWDCETIVSTYSNLDNHPAKIETPGASRRKKLSATVAGALNASSPLIALRGKEKLPVEFLPHSRKSVAEKPKSTPDVKIEQLKRKQHGQESKEEKKERKAAVKEERREARQIKKEMKGLYRGEAQRAQRVAAVAGPSSIHLM